MAVKVKSGDNNSYSDAPFEGRAKKQDPGISGWWQGITGGSSDLLRGAFNGLSSLEDYLASRQEGTTRRGDELFGPDKAAPGTVPRRHALSRGRSPQEDNRPDPMSFLDYLAMSKSLLGGGGTDYSALIQQLKQNAAEGDAHLSAMYDAYQGRLAASAPGIVQTYDTAGSGIDQNAAQATAAINDAYGASRNDQTQQLAALGIGDAAGVLAANGGLAATDQAANASGVARAAQVSGDLNDSNKGTALDFNTNFSNATGMAGVEQRSALQQALATKLAELESAQASEQGDRSKESIALAFQLADNAGLVDPNAAPDVMGQLDAQSKAAELYAQQLKNQQLQQTLGGQVGGNLAAYQQLAQQYGIDPSNFDEFTKFVTLVQSTQ